MAQSEPHLAYEVVAIHVAKADGSAFSLRGDRYIAHGVTLRKLVQDAYGIQSWQRIDPLPHWAETERYDIDAKMDADTYATYSKLAALERGHALAAMMQSLLADNFHLRLHTVTHQGPVYALVVAKGGAKLAPWPSDKPGWDFGWNSQSITLHGARLPILVSALSDLTARDVQDHTGLGGIYDIAVRWTPDEKQQEANAGPGLFRALELQLGLKLVADRGPVVSYVVDALERPEL